MRPIQPGSVEEGLTIGPEGVVKRRIYRTEIEGLLEGWAVMGTAVEHEERLVLTEVRVFPSRERAKYRLAHVPDAELPAAIEADGIELGTWDMREEVPPRGLSARLLRNDIRWGAVLEQLEVMARTVPVQIRDVLHLGKVERASVGGDAFYASVALAYEEAVRESRDAGEARPRPIQALSFAYGSPEATVKTWVQESRRRGFLSRAGPGRAGGHATADAHRVLDESFKGTEEA